jgi:archaellum component FlaG (FlaF/FlaG flagellin family)
MASEAISSSILLIGGVLGAAFLITAILPAIFSAGDTFGTAASSSEEKLKTDFRFINSYAKDNTPDEMKLWLKNVGTIQISSYDIQKSDIFILHTASVEQKSWSSGFTYDLPDPDNGYWDVGETLEITIVNPTVASTEICSVSFALPNSVRRSTTVSSIN